MKSKVRDIVKDATVQNLAAWKAKDRPYEKRVSKGLQARVSTTGAIAFIVQYVVKGTGKQIEYRLPPHWGTRSDDAHISLEDARLEAAKIRKLARDGVDHQKQVEDARKSAALELVKQEAVHLTVKDLFEKWVKACARKDGGKELRRSFALDVMPTIGNLGAQAVTKSMVVELLDNVVDRGSRIVARNLLGDVRQMFTFAIERELVERDPTYGLKRDKFGKKIERERTLSEAEIKLLPTRLADSRMTESNKAAIWIMLSTCCRVGEISQAEWKDVDLDSGTWRIPAGNSKNAKEHFIYLSTFAVHHFQTLQRLSGGSMWVLPARSNDQDKHIGLKSISKQLGDRQRGDRAPLASRTRATNALELPGGKWTAHDLRRSAATLMGDLGVRPDVIERTLNHVQQNKLIRIYQRQELKAEQREAWRLLGERLSLLTRSDADNVFVFKPEKISA